MSPRVLPVPVESPGTPFSGFRSKTASLLCVYGYPYGDSKLYPCERKTDCLFYKRKLDATEVN